MGSPTRADVTLELAENKTSDLDVAPSSGRLARRVGLVLAAITGAALILGLCLGLLLRRPATMSATLPPAFFTLVIGRQALIPVRARVCSHERAGGKRPHGLRKGAGVRRVTVKYPSPHSCDASAGQDKESYHGERYFARPDAAHCS